ncbi:MAG: orotidine-5'-phosphate decarboxylase [Bacteroidetes bacterium]|nr:orotidine-5'-phosphate decarboxylase [Bacteroidota bacterium]
MNRSSLIRQIRQKKSFLCVGLDSDILKMPEGISHSAQGLIDFNKAIIESTAEFAVAYKLNTAFYESLGAAGWEVMEKTLEFIPKDIFTIADAKRGDIGNTSAMYARAFFENLHFDSITVNPYMGKDSVSPFLDFEGKWSILLALTSNPGSQDFQTLPIGREQVYMQVLETSAKWGSPENMMYVVGATRAEQLARIREIIPNHFLLVPGVGAQGGSLEQVVKYGANNDIGLLINSSRSIIYASSGKDFAEAAGREAAAMQAQMKEFVD